MPPEPSWTTTRLGTVSPLTQLRSEALGRVVPWGHTVRKLEAVAPVTVTLATTAPAPVGTVAIPVTWTLRDPPGPRVPVPVPPPLHWLATTPVWTARVSQMRE